MSNEMLLRISRRQLLAATGGLTGLAVSGLGLPLVFGSAMADTPQKGGTLKFGRYADVVSFDPSQATDNMSIWANLLMFQMLIRSDATGTNLVSDLAESWDFIG